MTHFAPRRIATRLSWTIWVGLVCLMAVALLAACGGDGEEAAPSPEPVIQSTPVPTPADTPTPAPTPIPVPNTPTHVPDSSSFEVPHIDETTSWRDLTGALSEAELSCVQGELGEELYEAVLDGLVLRDIEAVEPWQGSLVGCLSQDTADDLFVATLEGGPRRVERRIRDLRTRNLGRLRLETDCLFPGPRRRRRSHDIRLQYDGLSVH